MSLHILTGGTALSPFRIERLRASLAAHAPADWMEQLGKADMSWMFDATGLI